MIVEITQEMIEERGSEEVSAFWTKGGRVSIIAYLYHHAVFFGHLSPFPLTIKMPCGNEYFFKKEKDIPSKSMPCKCGDETHYIFKYLYN